MDTTEIPAPEVTAPVVRTRTEILEFLGDTEPSAVLGALLNEASLPLYFAKPARKKGDKAEERLSLYGRLVARHDGLISDAICLTDDVKRWNELGPTGRLLYSMLSVDWPYDGAEDLLSYVEHHVRITTKQASLINLLEKE